MGLFSKSKESREEKQQRILNNLLLPTEVVSERHVFPVDWMAITSMRLIIVDTELGQAATRQRSILWRHVIGANMYHNAKALWGAWAVEVVTISQTILVKAGNEAQARDAVAAIMNRIK